MRSTIGVALVLALASSSLPVFSAAQREGPAVRGTSSVTGRVYDLATGAPVRRADVVAESEIAGRVATTTDNDGRFILDGLAAAPWRITVSKGGYIRWEIGQRRPFAPAPPVVLARGEEVTADIALSRGGAISGRIFDEYGAPLSDLQIRAYRSRMEQGQRRVEAVGVADLTDDTGAFRLHSLPPGDYYVGASLRVAPADSVNQTTYAPTYFPGTGDLGEAQRIRIGLGTEASATFPLLPIRRVRVSGMVFDSAGAPADAFLDLSSQALEFGRPLGLGAVTRTDGSFTFPDVPPGRYALTATRRGSGPDEHSSVPVTVFTDDVDGITLVTARPATLRGVFATGAAVSQPLPSGLGVMAIAARTGAILGGDSGRTFEIESLSEPFRLVVEQLPDGWSVESIDVGGLSALDDAVAPGPGQVYEARVVLTNRVTTVAGTVVGERRAEPIHVVVFPDDATKWGAWSRYVRVVPADDQGQFRVSGLPPVTRYLAVAVDFLEDGEETDPDFLSTMRVVGVPFALEEGQVEIVSPRIVVR